MDLLDLPQVLLSDLFINWLGVKHLCRYDAALCIRAKRPELVTMYAGLDEIKDLLTAPRKSPVAHVSSIMWSISRNIKVTEAAFTNDKYWTEQRDVMQAFFKQYGERLGKVKIDSCDGAMSNTMKLVTSSCPNLETLMVTRCTLTMAIPHMLKRKDIRIRELHLESKPRSDRKISKSYFANVQCHSVECLYLAGFLEESCLVEAGRAFPNLLDVHFRVRFNSPNYRRHHDRHWPSGKQDLLDFAAACNPHLRSICIQESDAVTVEVFGEMLSKWKYLKSIEILSEGRSWPVSVLQTIADHCAETLERFASAYMSFQNVHLLSMLKRCTACRALGVYGTLPSVVSLTEILQAVPDLRELDFRCQYALIGTPILQCIADHGRSLEVVNLTQRLHVKPPYTLHQEYGTTTPLAPYIAAVVHNCTKLRVLALAHDQKAAIDAARQDGRDVQVKPCFEVPKSIYY